MAIIMGMIFYLSHQPGKFAELPQIPGIDKLLHVIAYGSLAAAFLYGLHPLAHQPPCRDVAAVVAVLFCTLYGISDEYHQSFVPGRFVSAWDVAADGFGALLAAGWWLQYITGDNHKD